MATITVIIVSHNKPQLLPEAVESVLGQTFRDWQGILVDSGVLYDQGFFRQFPWADDPRLQIVKSGETPEMRRHKAMAPWCFNECFRRGLVAGELVMYLCDDDLLYANAFAAFVACFRDRPDWMAVYASQDISWVAGDSRTRIVGERRARAPAGRCCNGRGLDCQVDYLQLCHRVTALQAFSDDEYWPEARETQDHADGIFLEKLGSYFPIMPLDIKVSQNRRTVWSTYAPANGTGEDNLPPADFRPAGAFQADGDTLREDWEALLQRIGARPPGQADRALQAALADFQRRLGQLCEQNRSLRLRFQFLRYQAVDWLVAGLAQVPFFLGLMRWLLRSVLGAWKCLARNGRQGGIPGSRWPRPVQR
jgi:hypothetical protein